MEGASEPMRSSSGTFGTLQGSGNGKRRGNNRPLQTIHGDGAEESGSCLRAEKSWRTATAGREAPQIFCGPTPIVLAMTSRGEVQAGQEIRAHSPADCVACKHFFGRFALRSLSAARTELGLPPST